MREILSIEDIDIKFPDGTPDDADVRITAELKVTPHGSRAALNIVLYRPTPDYVVEESMMRVEQENERDAAWRGPISWHAQFSESVDFITDVRTIRALRSPQHASRRARVFLMEINGKYDLNLSYMLPPGEAF